MASLQGQSQAGVNNNAVKKSGEQTPSRPTYAERKAEEAAARRFLATEWLREMLIEAAEVLPRHPTEEEFRQGLRNGLILCNVLNKVHPGAVPKVIENPGPMVPLTDGAALSAIQYFENVRNFLVAVEELGLMSFEVSDLEEAGSTAKVVDCVLSMKSYYYWKQTGLGFFRPYFNFRNVDGIKFPTKGYGKTSEQGKMKDLLGNFDPTSFLDYLCLKFPESTSAKVAGSKDNSFNSNGMHPSPQMLSKLLLAILSERKDDGPLLLESMVRKMLEEFEQRFVRQRDQLQLFLEDLLQGEDNCLLKEETFEALSTVPNLKWDFKAGNGNYESKARLLNDSSDVQRTFDKDFYRSLEPKQKLQYLQQNKFQELKDSVQVTRSELETFQHEWKYQMEYLDDQIHGLAKAASAYHRVLEENRQLYNEVQDLKGSIRVYCRVRPFLPGQPDCQTTVDFIGENGTIMIVNPCKIGKDTRKTFTFNKIYGSSATQEEVFLDTQPLIRSVLDGYNVCIFAYGQTGSGKTYTMTGPAALTEQTWGVNYRALNDLFEISNNRTDVMSYHVRVQMVEIYNEQVRDLLVTDGSNKRLEIRNNSQYNGFNVPDASLVPVTSPSDVITLMNLGQKNRAVGSTALNDRSSRSHSVLTVHVEGADLTTGAILRGCLHLVDLAGSERVDKSEATGDRLKEAQHINKSLSALGDVIAALAQKSSHIPYRNSKLTQLLQDSLGGQAKALMFVHVSPEGDAYGETLSTLKFAERVASVELGAARSNKESAEVRELKEQISNLKLALAKKEAETEQLQGLRNSRIIMDRQTTRGVSPSRPLKQNSDAPALPNPRQTEEMRSKSIGRQRKPLQGRELGIEELDTNSPSLIRRPSPDKKSASVERKSVAAERRSASVDRRSAVKSRMEGAEFRRNQDRFGINSRDLTSQDDPLRQLEASDLAKHDSITDMFYQRRILNASKIYPEREERELLSVIKEDPPAKRTSRPDITGKPEHMMRITPEGSSTDDSEVDFFRRSDFSDSDMLNFKDLNLLDIAAVSNGSRVPRTQIPMRHPHLERRSPSRGRSPSSAGKLYSVQAAAQLKSRSVRQSTSNVLTTTTSEQARRPSPARKFATDNRISYK